MFVDVSHKAGSIDRFNQEKLYIQATRLMLEEIRSGRWPLDHRIPSEEELSHLYGVSRITIKQALGILVADGYLTRIQGKGTFVVSVQPVVGLAMKTQFAEEMFGKEVATEKQVLFKGPTEPPAEVRQYLATDDDIYQVTSLRIVGGDPAFLDQWYIPVRELPDIDRIDLNRQALYATLQERGTRKIFKAVQTLEVKPVAEPEAATLGLAAGTPVLVVHRLLMGSDEDPLGYARIMGKADKYKFRTEFDRIR